MTFPRYPSYKNSGMEWLEEVPEHWDTRKVRWLFEVKKRIAGELGYDVISITQQGFRIRDIESNDGQLSMDYSKYQFVEVDDFAMNHMDLLTGGVDIATERGVTSPDYRVFSLRDSMTCYDRYMLYLFRMGYRNRIFYAFGQGSSQLGRWRFPTEAFNDFVFPLPPYSEQISIAAFIDCETAKIDSLVAEQHRLMELLKEKRQAVISNAVTKGLNPHALMKPSGIEWLGDVPDHWEVMRMGNLFREVGEPGTDELPILSVSIHHGVSDKEVPEEELERKVTRSDDRSKYLRVSPGDLVYNMMRAWQGGFGTVTVEGMVSPAYVVARPRKQFETIFIEQLLRTPQAIEQMRRHSRGITDFRLRLYWDEFKNIRVPLPPPEEVTAICACVKAMDETFHNMASISERAVDLLLERRTALIFAAATGQIDVRAFTEGIAV